MAGGSDDDSGKDSDEEEISRAKEKFEDFFKRTKKYWISFARDRLSQKEKETVSVEDYALVLAEEEFMKETIPSSLANDRRYSAAAVSAPAANHRDRNAPIPANNNVANRNHPVHPQPQRHAAPNAPLQQQVNQLQHQLQRVDLDEGIE